MIFSYIIWIPYFYRTPLAAWSDQSRLLCPTCFFTCWKVLALHSRLRWGFRSLNPKKKNKTLDLGAKSVQETVSSHKVILLVVKKFCSMLIESLSHYLQRLIHLNGGWPWDFFLPSTVWSCKENLTLSVLFLKMWSNGSYFMEGNALLQAFLEPRTKHACLYSHQAATNWMSKLCFKTRHSYFPWSWAHFFLLTFCSATYQVL